MKENGAIKEDGAAKLLLLQALSEMCGRCVPGTAIILIYNIMLGRDPDPDGEAFYGARLDGPPEQRLGALRELATSDEARRYGLFSLTAGIAEIDVGAVHLPEEPLGVLAVLGLMRRRMIETMERLDNIESLARITLLSVPEWCGSAYTDLERRLAALEDTVAAKRVQAR
jgi:hypothetical protein